MLALAAADAVVFLWRWELPTHTGKHLVYGGRCSLYKGVCGHTMDMQRALIDKFDKEL